MWFKALTGFHEASPQQVRQNLTVTVDENVLKSHVNGKTWICGQLETPTLAELRERLHTTSTGTSTGTSTNTSTSTSTGSQTPSGKLSLREVVANVQHLHMDEANAGSLFQVASQFNLLEMTSSRVTPEKGVGIYAYDATQGPACAIAAGAGTIYRNYFANVNGQTGQSANNQIDCLADLGAALGNSDSRLWEMKNGYALASENGLIEIDHRLQTASESELDALRQVLRIGLQWNTQVTLPTVTSQYTVTQAYCSALPVSYSRHPAHLWARFARLVLEAAYEATICTAILNASSTGNNRVFLTLLGGGVFGNEMDWIMGAIQRALNLYKEVDLDVAIVSYGTSNRHVQQLVNQWMMN